MTTQNTPPMLVTRPRPTKRHAELLAEEWTDYGFTPVSILPSCKYRDSAAKYVVRGFVSSDRLPDWARWLGVEARRDQLKRGGE